MNPRLLIVSLITLVVVSLLVVLSASPAAALDPACDQTLPGFSPHDTTKPYVRPLRDVHFCSTHTSELEEAGLLMRCVVTLDGTPYASAPSLLPGTEVTLSSPSSGSGVLVFHCEVPGVDGAGNPVTRASQTSSVNYVPEPMLPAPIPLE